VEVGPSFRFGAAASLILLIAAAACLIPAFRALRVSPMAVLKSE
jgi:ABC-type antimicrobial peptide transport system permease subunit